MYTYDAKFKFWEVWIYPKITETSIQRELLNQLLHQKWRSSQRIALLASAKLHLQRMIYLTPSPKHIPFNEAHSSSEAASIQCLVTQQSVEFY